MTDTRLIVEITANFDTQLINIDLDNGTRKISIGLNSDEAQQFSVLLDEAVTTLTLHNMRAYEQQQSGPKH